MSPKSIVRTTAIGISFAYSLVLVIAGVQLDTVAKQIVAGLPAFSTVVAVIFDVWAWRWPGVRRLVARPDVRGTWRVDLNSHPDSHIPDGGNRGTVEAFLLIEQSFWTFSATLLTQESQSRSIASSFQHDAGSRVQTLTFTYQNVPRP